MSTAVNLLFSKIAVNLLEWALLLISGEMKLLVLTHCRCAVKCAIPGAPICVFKGLSSTCTECFRAGLC